MTTTMRSDSAIRGTRRTLIVLCSTIAIVSVSSVIVPASDHRREGDDSRAGSVWVVNRDLGELAVFDAKNGPRPCYADRRSRGTRRLHFRAGP